MHANTQLRIGLIVAAVVLLAAVGLLVVGILGPLGFGIGGGAGDNATGHDGRHAKADPEGAPPINPNAPVGAENSHAHADAGGGNRAEPLTADQLDGIEDDIERLASVPSASLVATLDTALARGRYAIIETLARRPDLGDDEQVVGRMKLAVQVDNASFVRHAAVRALGKLRPPGLCEWCCELVARHWDTEIISEALRVLRELADPACRDTAGTYLLRSGAPNRYLAIDVLVALNSEDAAATIAYVATKPDLDTRTRARAITALVQLNAAAPTRTRSTLETLSADPDDPTIARVAQQALASLPTDG